MALYLTPLQVGVLGRVPLLFKSRLQRVVVVGNRGTIEAAQQNGRELSRAVDAALSQPGLAIEGPVDANLEAIAKGNGR